MAISVVLNLVFAMLVVTAVTAPKAKADLSCGLVVKSLSPCITYVSNGGQPAPTCCNGVKSLFTAAKTTGDRQSVCRCIKSAVAGVSYNSKNLGLAAGLPGKCGVNIPYKISPSTDCNSVK